MGPLESRPELAPGLTWQLIPLVGHAIGMNRILRVLITAAIALVLLFAADILLRPVPVAAATAVVGCLVPLCLGRGCRLRYLALAVFAGLLAGVGIHLWVHVSGGSPSPEEGLAAHLLVDGGIGFGVALVILVVLAPLSGVAGARSR